MKHNQAIQGIDKLQESDRCFFGCILHFLYNLCKLWYDGTQTNVVLPENIQKALEEIEQLVIDGTLVPPETMDEIEAWAAANQYGK